MWYSYSKTIKYSSKFLSQFCSYSDFYKFVDKFYNDDELRPLLPINIKLKIPGFGFALACDFLKELGYTKYSKPDTHTKDILMGVGYVFNKTKNSLETDYLSYIEMQKIAEANNITPYEIDKILWLIGSGSFYLSDDKNIGSKKKQIY